MEVLEQFFKDKGSSENTMKLYQYAVMHYENLHNKDIAELLEEADREEEQGIRWKKRSIRRYLIQFRNDLYTSKSENTAKKYMSCIKTLYRHYEIELQPLPSFDSKQIDKTYELSFEDILTKQEIKDAYYEANNVCKCIILMGISTGLSKIDMLNLTVDDFLSACKIEEYTDVLSALNTLKKENKLISCFIGERKKTLKKYITFASPESNEHIIQYLIGRDARLKNEYDSQLMGSDKLFDISESHLNYSFRQINDKLNLGKVGKQSKFRCHQLRKYHASTLLNIEDIQWTVNEIDTLQGRSQDMTHRAYFHNSTDKLCKKYYDSVDELMLFKSIHQINKDDYDELKKENKLYMEEIAISNEKLESQQRTIEQIMDNQRELEKLLGL